jgi:hypothetical protein
MLLSYRGLINFVMAKTQFPGDTILGGMYMKKHTVNTVLFKKNQLEDLWDLGKFPKNSILPLKKNTPFIGYLLKKIIPELQNRQVHTE